MSTRIGSRLEIHTEPGIDGKKDMKTGSPKFELVALAQLTEYFQTFLKLKFFFYSFISIFSICHKIQLLLSIQFNDL